MQKLKIKIIFSIILSLIILISASNSLAMIVPAGFDPNISDNINYSATYNSPTQANQNSTDFSDKTLQNKSTISNSTTAKAKQNNSSPKNQPVIWYWLGAFIVIIFTCLVWGFRKLR